MVFATNEWGKADRTVRLGIYIFQPIYFERHGILFLLIRSFLTIQCFEFEPFSSENGYQFSGQV